MEGPWLPIHRVEQWLSENGFSGTTEQAGGGTRIKACCAHPCRVVAGASLGNVFPLTFALLWFRSFIP